MYADRDTRIASRRHCDRELAISQFWKRIVKKATRKARRARSRDICRQEAQYGR